MLGCSVEHTEVHKYDYKGGVGVKVSQEAEAVLEDCLLHSHDGPFVSFALYSACSFEDARLPVHALHRTRACVCVHACVRACVCVCVCARARVRACVLVCARLPAFTL